MRCRDFVTFLAGMIGVMAAMLPALAESIQLKQSGGVYMLPVRINDTVTVPFVLDSGAAEVSIPEDVFSVLRRSETISQSDFVGSGKYTIAGGATVSSDRYILHKMSVGDRVITDVVANVLSVKGDPLLGQSFLQKLPAWTLDNGQHALVLHDDVEAAGGPQPQTAARAPTPVPQRKALAPATPSAPALPTGASLQDIFTGDMLNIQVPFLESRVGIARRVFNVAGEQRRTYTVEGCDVTAYVSKNQVVAYGLLLGVSQSGSSLKKDENCNITIPGGDKLRSNHLTIGKFINVMGVGIAETGNLFHAACITMCGNAADPTVEFHWEGPHSTGFLK